MIILGFDILESNRDIVQGMLQEIKIAMDRGLKKARKPVEKAIQDLVAEKLRQAPEYDELIFGQLSAEFGLYQHEAEAAVDGIVDRLASEVSVSFIPLTYSTFSFVQGGYSIELFSGNYSDIVTWNQGIIDDLTRGYSLPWLNWLLLKGGAILVRDYTVIFNFPNSQLYASRSRLGLMRKKKGKSWRVPSQFQGTERNNWITRSLKGIDADIENIIENELKKVF